MHLFAAAVERLVAQKQISGFRHHPPLTSFCSLLANSVIDVKTFGLKFKKKTFEM